jgi:hypothetical protein
MTPSSNRLTQKGSFINNAERSGVDLLASNLTIIDSDTIETTVEFVTGMYAEAAAEDSPYLIVPVSENNQGFAQLDLSDDYVIGTKVEWKLFRTSIEQKQAISKVLKRKPGADI